MGSGSDQRFSTNPEELTEVSGKMGWLSKGRLGGSGGHGKFGYANHIVLCREVRSTPRRYPGILLAMTLFGNTGR